MPKERGSTEPRLPDISNKAQAMQVKSSWTYRRDQKPAEYHWVTSGRVRVEWKNHSSELCPHFLSHELLFPPCEHYASLRIEMLWLCAFALSVPSTCHAIPHAYFHTLYISSSMLPSWKLILQVSIHLVPSERSSMIIPPLSQAETRSRAPHFSNNSQKAWTLRLSLFRGSKRGMLLFSH